MEGAQASEETLGHALIPVINKLQDIFAQLLPEMKLDLPQVAVIGSQSSGKSSVLESLVGRDFLPRGCNVVTRRPLILQLVRLPAAGEAEEGGSRCSLQEWGEFLHLPGKRFHDFERIRGEIQSETDRLAGTNKGVCEAPIRLRICSPHVLTMTLIDLPGITRVAVGDQPADIESRIRDLNRAFIEPASCLILAVSPANADLATSDALRLAAEVDPAGERTLGVLTKLDIMDRGTDACAALANDVVPLKLGYVGVVLRSQEDIVRRLPVREARHSERSFFEQHPAYAGAAARGRCGTGALARAANALLAEHIRAALPDLRERLEHALEARGDELRALGEAAPGPTGAARGAALLTLLDAYARRFGEMLDGRGEHLPVDQLAGGARLRHVFHDIFRGGLEALDPGAQLSDDDVRTAIRNSGGVKGALLIPEAPFELLVRRAIERLLPPALQAKEYVHAELLRVAAQCAPPELQRFPVLQSLLAEAVEAFVAEGAAPAEVMIRNLVSCELALINTSHPAFVGGNRAIAQVLERRAAEEDRKATGRAAAGGRGGAAGGGGGPHAHQSQPPTAPSGPQPGPLRAGARTSETSAPAPREPSAEEGGRGEGPADARAPNPLLSPLERPGLAGLASEGLPGGRPGWFRGWFAGRSESSEAGEAGSLMRSGDAEARSIYGLGERFAAALSTGPSGGGPGGLPRPPTQLRVPGQASDQEGVQVEVTRLLVSSYFDVVRKNLQDMVPKALMLFMVGHVQRDLQQHLIRSLYREELFAELMTERQDVAAKRSHCQRALKALRAALSTLEAMPQELSGGGGGRRSSRGASLLKEGASRARREALAAEPKPEPRAIRLALPPAQERFGGAGSAAGTLPDSPTGASPWDLPQADQRVRGRIAAVR